MNPLTSAVRSLFTSLRRLAGETIVYRRGNDSIDLTAVPVRSRQEDFANDDELSLTARQRDWIIFAEQLAIGGEQTLPQRNDEIDWVDSLGSVHTYQVLPRPGERCYRHTDPTLTQLRVYTVERIPNSE